MSNYFQNYIVKTIILTKYSSKSLETVGLNYYIEKPKIGIAKIL